MTEALQRNSRRLPYRGRMLILGFVWAINLISLPAADPVLKPPMVKKNQVERVLATLPKVEKPAPRQPPTGLPEDTHLDKDPVRQTKGLDLTRMGWSYNCNECHRLFPARWHHTQFVEHKNIRLDHGANRFCLNCHHPTDRGAFSDYDGSVIPEENVVQLCGRCHGPAYRDWKAGVHGRKNGYWLKSRGPQTQLRCIQCHDPHSPKFKPIQPLPPPTYPARAAKSLKRKESHEH
jgi:hypothetical protein